MKYSKILLFMAALLCLAFQACAVSESLNDTSLNDTSLNDTSLNDTSLNDTSLNDTSLNDTSLNDTSLNDTSLNDTIVSSADWISPNIAQMAAGTNSDPGLAGMLQWLDTPVPDFPWYTTGGSFYSQEYSDITFSPFTEYYVTSGTPVVGGIISNPTKFDITQKTPNSVYYGAGVGLPFSQYAAVVPSKTNDLWVQGATNWTQYVVSPVGTWLQLIAYAPVEGPAGFYEMIQTGTTASKYNTYQFNEGYNTMNYKAEEVGRHMLYFVVNSQPSNVVIVDVLAQAEPGNAGIIIYPAERQESVTVLGNAANSGRFTTSRSLSQISDGLTTTTTPNGQTTTTSDGQTTITPIGQTTTTSDGTYQTTTTSDGITVTSNNGQIATTSSG
jgi:hypothetical protein